MTLNRCAVALSLLLLGCGSDPQAPNAQPQLPGVYVGVVTDMYDQSCPGSPPPFQYAVVLGVSDTSTEALLDWPECPDLRTELLGPITAEFELTYCLGVQTDTAITQFAFIGGTIASTPGGLVVDARMAWTVIDLSNQTFVTCPATRTGTLTRE